MNRILQIIILLASTFVTSAQITEVAYVLNYDCDENLYEVGIKALEGQANTILTRAQFNAQITILVPTGAEIEVVEMVNPIVNNQNYDGTQPVVWRSDTPLVAPANNPDLDYHPFQPQLAPAGFYNDIVEGEEVVLFRLRIGDYEEHNEAIRLYDNETDTNGSTSSGGDFRNGFTLGSPAQLYSGNIHKVCGELALSTSQIQALVSIYPNPAIDVLNVGDNTPYHSFTIAERSGQIISSGRSASQIDISALDAGLYLLTLWTDTGSSTHRFIKK